MSASTTLATMESHHHPPAQSRGSQVKAFVWHFVQMVIAMMVGMGIYHLLAGKALAAYPVLNFAGMQLSMVLPMVVLMHYQRHTWQRTLEMAGAMLVGPAVFVACAALDLHTYVPGLSIKTLFVLGDISMYVGMLGIMLYRRAEYTTKHSAHSGR